MLRVLNKHTTGLVRSLAETRVTLTSQWRSMFIQVRDTPNPHSLMFMPGTKVLGSGTVHFTNTLEAKTSPLAKSLFRVEGVKEVFLASDFITIVKVSLIKWEVQKKACGMQNNKNIN